MAFVLVTIIALVVVAQGFQFPPPGGMDARAGGAVLAGVCCSLIVEVAILRWQFRRISDGHRWLRRSLGWIAFNASVAVVCGAALALLLRSPLLDQARTVVVIGIAVLIEWTSVVLVPGLLWQKRIVKTPLTRSNLIRSARWFALLNGASAVVFMFTGAAWLKGYDQLAAKHVHNTPNSLDPRERPCADAGAVVVARFDEPLPTDQKKLERWLWNKLANQPAEQQFSGCTTRDWERRYWLFTTALVDRARTAGLESAALERALTEVFPTGPAYLPVGAYRAQQEGAGVWILVIKWEDFSEQRQLSLGHIRFFVFDIDSGRQIAYFSCM